MMFLTKYFTMLTTVQLLQREYLNQMCMMKGINELDTLTVQTLLTSSEKQSMN